MFGDLLENEKVVHLDFFNGEFSKWLAPVFML